MDKLDREILDWIASHSDDRMLREQLHHAKVVRRDYMRTGFFVYFELPDGVPLLDGIVRPLCPDILSPLLLDGAGSSLFFKNGRAHYLEIYARGGFFPKNLAEFQLESPV
jgi:hypothetical protein